jgi:hypothetical protein
VEKRTVSLILQMNRVSSGAAIQVIQSAAPEPKGRHDLIKLFLIPVKNWEIDANAKALG